MDKSELRKIIKAQKRSLTEETICSDSRCICDKLMTLPEFADNDDIYVYINYNQEVITKDFIRECFALGKNVFVPKVVNENMVFVRINSLDELNKSNMGILEPDSNIDTSTGRGLMIMPLLAADTNFNRLGYGGGYYDRYLSSNNNYVLIGLAYDFQIVESVETQEFDIPLDLIITPTRLFQK